ncbi:hypothetical protein ZWY2020_038470 [Hordeum vulgare]|nr:hypothetical protein ZWY2020_038470 [Hordeum vulgare]
MATAAQTVGESLAHVTRTKRWVTAVFLQLFCPVGITSILIYGYTSESSPSFFSSVPWRLPLVLSYGAYLSVIFLIESYAGLFLPRTPLAVIEKLRIIGAWGVGMGVLGVMVSVVLGTAVEDSRVLAGCTCLVAVSVAGLVVFWVWLARMYGSLESFTVPAATGQLPRVPI